MFRRALCALALALCIAAPAAALEVRVKTITVHDGTVSAVIEIHDLLPDRFSRMLDDGGTLHLRVQAELWQSRPVWDRLVYPAAVLVLRVARAAGGGDLTLTSAAGDVTTYRSVPDEMPLVIEIGKSDRLAAVEQYYLQVVATVGTIADREIDQFGDAVFGSASDANGLGSLGRAMFRKMLEIGDYLQSTTAETRGRRITGRDILRR